MTIMDEDGRGLAPRPAAAAAVLLLLRFWGLTLLPGPLAVGDLFSQAAKSVDWNVCGRRGTGGDAPGLHGNGLVDTAAKSVTGDTQLVALEEGVPEHLRAGDCIVPFLWSRTLAVGVAADVVAPEGLGLGLGPCCSPECTFMAVMWVLKAGNTPRHLSSGVTEPAAAAALSRVKRSWLVGG